MALGLSRRRHGGAFVELAGRFSRPSSLAPVVPRRGGGRPELAVWSGLGFGWRRSSAAVASAAARLGSWSWVLTAARRLLAFDGLVEFAPPLGCRLVGAAIDGAGCRRRPTSSPCWAGSGGVAGLCGRGRGVRPPRVHGPGQGPWAWRALSRPLLQIWHRRQPWGLQVGDSAGGCSHGGGWLGSPFQLRRRVDLGRRGGGP